MGSRWTNRGNYITDKAEGMSKMIVTKCQWCGKTCITRREMDVLSLLAKELSLKEIAVEMGTSYQTVKNHMFSLEGKFGVNDKATMLLRAIREGFIK